MDLKLLKAFSRARSRTGYRRRWPLMLPCEDVEHGSACRLPFPVRHAGCEVGHKLSAGCAAFPETGTPPLLPAVALTEQKSLLHEIRRV
jgi:hypothetical protein